MKSTAARLAQSVERKALNLVVVGSSPTVGVSSSQACRSPTYATFEVVIAIAHCTRLCWCAVPAARPCFFAYEKIACGADAAMRSFKWKHPAAHCKLRCPGQVAWANGRIIALRVDVEV